MNSLFGGGGFRIDPDIQSTIEHDYWEEFTKVNNAFSHEPDIAIKKIKKAKKNETNNQNRISDSTTTTTKNGYHKESEVHDISEKAKDGSGTVFYPRLPSSNDEMKVPEENPDESYQGDDDESEIKEYRSIAVQTESYLYDAEPELPYSCCFCFKSSTPCVVWMFVIISIIFFKMGAIVTGRWIYLSSSSFDEVVFYIAFTVCLGFATLYFRRGTKYHNPFDLLFLMLTVPIMWFVLTFTTTFLKKDMFFYVGSGIYSVFILPYSGIGCYITYRFWKQGKLFLKRVEGDKVLEPHCRKLFFCQSLMMFDTQCAICAAIISMAPTVNASTTAVWIHSLLFGPISILIAIAAMIIGYFAIRRENKILTWIYTVLSGNQFILVICMLLKRPTSPDAYTAFINVAIVFASTLLLIVHIGLLVVIWNWIVPFYGKGLKGPLNRTSKNNCIQCAKLTICR